MEEGKEAPGLYRARVAEYYAARLYMMSLQTPLLQKLSTFGLRNGYHVQEEQRNLFLQTHLPQL